MSSLQGMMVSLNRLQITAAGGSKNFSESQRLPISSFLEEMLTDQLILSIN